MSLLPLEIFNSFSAGIVFIRQNLMSLDVRFLCIRTVPMLKGLKPHGASKQPSWCLKASF